MTLRAPLYTRRWAPDLLGISGRSQDGIRNNLLETTLRSQDAFLQRARIELGRPPDPIRLIDRFQANNLVLTTLLGKDAKLPGAQWFELPKSPAQPDRFWAQNLALTTLAIATGWLASFRTLGQKPLEILRDE